MSEAEKYGAEKPGAGAAGVHGAERPCGPVACASGVSAEAEAERAARDGAAAGTAFYGPVGEGAHGRGGREWLPGPGSLEVSVVLRPQAPMPFLEALTPLAALAACETLRGLGFCSVCVGWPNDLVAGERKLGAARVHAGYASGGVFAVATVRVNGEAADLDVRACGSPCPMPAVGLDALAAEEGVPAPKAPALAEALAGALVGRVRLWEQALAAGRGAAGPWGPFLEGYFDFTWHMGRPVTALAPDGRVRAEGRLAGIDGWVA